MIMTRFSFKFCSTPLKHIYSWLELSDWGQKRLQNPLDKFTKVSWLSQKQVSIVLVCSEQCGTLTYKSLVGLWTHWSTRRCFRSSSRRLRPPPRLICEACCWCHSLELDLAWIGRLREIHLHKLPVSVMQYVAPEKQRQCKKKGEKGF